jgi:hypothetical protein
MVFGRVANDTWGVGRKDVTDGTVTTLADMTLVSLRANKLEIDGTNDRIFVNTDFTIDAAQDIVLDAAGGNVKPASDDQAALGVAGTAFSDLFLADGGVINFNNGDVTATHSSNLLAIAGGNTRVDRLEVDGATNYLDVGIADSDDLVIVAADDLQIQAAEIFVSGVLQPDAGGTRDLGTSTSNFKNAFVNTLTGSAVEAVILDRNGTQKIKKLGTSGDLEIVNAASNGKILFRDAFFGSSTYADGGDQGIPLAISTAEIDAFETAFGSEKSIIGAITDAKGGGASGKLTLAVSASIAPGTDLQIEGLSTKRGAVAVAEQKERIDVFVNGQLLLSGSSGSEDYFLSTTKDSELAFNFAVVADDVVTVIIR